MLQQRKFNVKVMGGAEKSVDYNGNRVRVKL
jgi:hypothetical protein